MPPLVFETYLGPAVDEMAGIVAARLAGSGQAVVLAPPADDAIRRARILAGEWDLLWACGLFTAQMLDARPMRGAVVAAPVFSGAAKAVYHSVLIAAAERPGLLDGDLGDARLAVNQWDSWSGYGALDVHLGGMGRGVEDFGARVLTGSHLGSIEAVADGWADLAAIDHVLWEWWLRSNPDTDLRVLGRTDDWPAPPFTVRRGTPGDVTRSLLEVGSVPGLERIVAADVSAYQAMCGSPEMQGADSTA